MKWQSNIIDNLAWSEAISNREAKEKVAQKIAEKVKDGDVIGVGSGSTSFLALQAIAQKVKAEKLAVKAIPTSIELSMACSHLGIPLTTLFENRPDWLFDGADEVDPKRSLIKGRGGAMFKEKLMIASSRKNYIIVDESKLVDRLCTRFPIPIEVFPQALLHVEDQLKKLDANSVLLRPAKGKDGPVITENGNLIIDAMFDEVPDDFEVKLKSVVGVVETGLFINYDVEIVVA